MFEITSDLKQYVTNAHSHHGGSRIEMQFPNGFGVSIVRFPGSYGYDDGLLELAVIDSDGHLHYDNPVADGDVRGYLTPEEALVLVEEVRNFPAK